MALSEKRIALVTGAAKGIGKAAAADLAASGFRVYINYRSSDIDAQNTRDQILSCGGDAELLPFDVTDSQQCDTAVKAIVKKSGRIDVLVNNAGLRQDQLLAMMKEKAWQAVIDTNLNGFYNLTKPVVKQMLKNRYGRIVNITSTAGILGNAGQVNYSASKAGLIGATKALARELANRNITVNAVAPGFIETSMIEGMPQKNMIDTIPAGRIGSPEEVAFAISFLCSDRASYINGQVIGVNGGMI